MHARSGAVRIANDRDSNRVILEDRARKEYEKNMLVLSGLA